MSKTLKQRLHDAEVEIEDLKIKLKGVEGSRDMYRTSSNGYLQELNQLHEVLDALPGSIPKRAEDCSVLTRLAAWLGSTK